jgi:hypothetical protein
MYNNGKGGTLMLEKEENARISLYPSKDTLDIVAQRAKQNKRSINKEFLWIIEEYLKQEKQRLAQSA